MRGRGTHLFPPPWPLPQKGRSQAVSPSHSWGGANLYYRSGTGQEGSRGRGGGWGRGGRPLAELSGGVGMMNGGQRGPRGPLMGTAKVHITLLSACERLLKALKSHRRPLPKLPEPASSITDKHSIRARAHAHWHSHAHICTLTLTLSHMHTDTHIQTHTHSNSHLHTHSHSHTPSWFPGSACGGMNMRRPVGNLQYVTVLLEDSCALNSEILIICIKHWCSYLITEHDKPLLFITVQGVLWNLAPLLVKGNFKQIHRFNINSLKRKW